MKKITLAGARASANLTQEELAKELGVSRATVNAWETGRKPMGTIQFIAFCAVTGFEKDDIFLPEKST